MSVNILTATNTGNNTRAAVSMLRPVNTSKYATVQGKFFSMQSALSNSRTTELCNPFLSNGSANIFPRIGPYYESGDVINNRTVFSVGSVQSAYKRSEGSDRVSSGAVLSQS
jgi:hypothetical protein